MITSDDSFETDDSGVKEGYNDKIEELKMDMEFDKVKEVGVLERCLEKNRPDAMMNRFYRK